MLAAIKVDPQSNGLNRAGLESIAASDRIVAARLLETDLERTTITTHEKSMRALVAQPADEALGERVLLRLAGLNVVPINTARLCPLQDRHAGQLRVAAHQELARRRL